MDETFELFRGERRSFFCPNKLWYEIIKQTKDCISVSTYIRQAVVEKMIRDNPNTKEYFTKLNEN